ncbi:MAG: Gfo/Idh/MocA family oxidoreductase, partial [Methylococcales bacterium]
MKKIKCAVIGTGYLGKFHAEKYALLPDCELVAVVDINQEAEQAVADEFDIKRRPEAGMIPAGENDITVRKDGKGFIYTINNQGAMEALRSVNNEDIPSILKPIAAFTRFQARMVTQFMPLFAPTNMIRDVAERSENIRTR